MRFESALLHATLLRRYKRFLADVRLADGQELTVHCADPGRMSSVLAPPQRALLSPALPGRKLPYRLEMLEVNQGWVGVRPALANALFAECLQQQPQLLGSWAENCEVTAEVANGQQRFDFLLQPQAKPPVWVEVKSATFKRDGAVVFPDSVTARGAAQLARLTQLLQAGERAMLVYVVQRADVLNFELAADVDATYAQACQVAREAGLEIQVLGCDVSPEGLTVARRLCQNGLGERP